MVDESTLEPIGPLVPGISTSFRSSGALVEDPPMGRLAGNRLRGAGGILLLDADEPIGIGR